MHVHRMKRTEGSPQNLTEAGSNFSRDPVFIQVEKKCRTAPREKRHFWQTRLEVARTYSCKSEHPESERYLTTADQFVSGTACPFFTTVGYTLSNPL